MHSRLFWVTGLTSQLAIQASMGYAGLMLVVTRKEARTRGLKRYFTGKPCKHGHVAERWVANTGCTVCLLAANPKKRPRNSDKKKAYDAQWYAANRQKVLANAARRRARARFVSPESN